MSTTICVYPSAWNTRMEMCHTCRWECDSCSKAWALRRFIYCFNDAVCFIFMYFVRNDEIKNCELCITSQLSVQSIKPHHLYVGNIGIGTCLDILGRYDINYTFGTRQSCRKCVNWLIWMNGIDRPIEKEHDSPIDPVIILFMRPANERRRYSVTSSLVGWSHTQDDPCRPWDKFNNWEVWSITVQLTNWNQNHPEYHLFCFIDFFI